MPNTPKNIHKINGNVKIFKSNIERIFANKKNVTFRIPLAKNYIVTENNIKLIMEFLTQYKPNKVEVFEIHNLAEKKYKTLNREIMKIEDVTQEEVIKIKKEIEKIGINVSVCKI